MTAPIDGRTARLRLGPIWGCQYCCNNPDDSTVTSDPIVPIRVIPAEMPESLVVRVIARSTGTPLEGATIIVGEQSVVTDEGALLGFLLRAVIPT